MESNSVSLLVYEILAIIFQIIGVIFNGAIIWTLRKKSLFKCPSNKFVFSLCLSQLLVSIINFLISVTQSFLTSSVRIRGTLRSLSSIDSNDLRPTVSQIESGNHHYFPIENINNYFGLSQNGQMTFILCHVQLYVTFIVAIGASLTIGLISVDRYITIALPMKYKSIVTPGRTTLVIILCWVVSVLITLLPPFFIFGNETLLHGPIVIPMGVLGLYFAILFSIVTILVLFIMITCYNRIFKIAKEKCQKVQIGHFTSPISSISSDWPSSAYSSHHEGQRIPNQTSTQTGTLTSVKCGSPQRLVTSNSLLQYVLLANLGKNVVPGVELQTIREPFVLSSNEHEIDPIKKTESLQNVTVVKVPSSSRSRCRSAAQHHRNRTPVSQSIPIAPVSLLKQNPRGGVRKWKTFLQHNYNSPRKTVSTIVMLIGTLTLTQVPLTLALYTTTLTPTVFYFSFKIFLSLSAISSPILYGFLNRTIRIYLWKLLRIRRPYTVKGFSFIGSKTYESRKESISSASSQFCQGRRESHLQMDSSYEKIKNNHLNICNDNNNKGLDYRRPEFSPEITTPTIIEEENIEEDDDDRGRNCKIFATSKFVSNHEKKEDNQICEDAVMEFVEVYLDPGNEIKESFYKEVPEEFSLEDGNEDELSSSFPRKPSQDSGADVSFSEDEEEMKGSMEKNIKILSSDLNISESTVRVRLPPRSTHLTEETKESELSKDRRIVLTLSLTEDIDYMDENESEVESLQDSEPDDLFDFDEDEHFEQMKDIIKKKFSLTDEDVHSIRSLDLDYFDEEGIMDMGHSIQV